MDEVLAEVDIANTEWKRQEVAQGIPSRHLDQRTFPKGKALAKVVSSKRPHMEWGDRQMVRTPPPSSSSFIHHRVHVLKVFIVAQGTKDI